MAPLFSIVVPAYGSARCLPRLFESLEAQTCQDFEVLFAVEESPDDSLECCRKWAQGRNAQVASLPCTGAAGASRNWCYEHATGKYLLPLDGDDWFEPDAIQVIADALKKADYPEVLITSMRVWLEAADGSLTRGEVIANLPSEADGECFSGYDLIRRIGRSGHHCKNYAGLNVVRTDFLRENHLTQLVGVSSEDSEWVPRLWITAQKMAFLAAPYYNYRRHDGSVSSVGSTKVLFSTAKLLCMLMELFETRDLPKDVEYVLKNDAVSIFLWYLFNKLYRRRFTNADRLKALDIILGDSKNAANFKKLWHNASKVKRLGVPLIRFAHKTGIIFPAVWYYRYLYYPLSNLKK